ncbi:MAG: thioesterase family protein [Phycisphaeraceae bacterium]
MPTVHDATIQVRVRYAECDPMRVAHHSAYAVWLEIARTELLRQGGVSYRQLEAAGVMIVVARLSIRFRRPALYDDLLDIHTHLQPIHGVKIEHHYRIMRGSDLIADAQTTVVCVDAQGKLQPVPALLQS